MFERTFTFWRRLVGRGDAPATAPAAAANGRDERRLWVRYPADLKTSVHLAADAAPVKSPAKIRNISRGGANLLVDAEIQPGQLITLELPSASEGDYAVLACVVRAEREPSGKWAVGCVFSRELSEDDLQRFGARRIRHAPDDKRLWMRFPSNIRLRFQPVGADEESKCEAQVLNLSANGVGLVVGQAIDAGALLNVELLGKDGVTRPILACVVHVSEQEGNRWALGCNFIRELSEADLQALV